MAPWTPMSMEFPLLSFLSLGYFFGTSFSILNYFKPQCSMELVQMASDGTQLLLPPPPAWASPVRNPSCCHVHSQRRATAAVVTRCGRCCRAQCGRVCPPRQPCYRCSTHSHVPGGVVPPAPVPVVPTDPRQVLTTTYSLCMLSPQPYHPPASPPSLRPGPTWGLPSLTPHSQVSVGSHTTASL